MKRLIALLLCAAITAAALCGCSTRSPVSEPTAADSRALQEESADPIVQTAELPGLERQYACIAENAALWMSTAEPGDEHMYTVADLDGNGLLEVINSVCAGTGMYSTSLFFEVNADCTGLTRLDYGVPEGDSEPDLMYGRITMFTGEGQNWYIFDDAMPIGPTELSSVRYGLSKQGNTILLEPICRSVSHYDPESDEAGITYYDAAGQEISEDAYLAAPAKHFSHYAESAVELDWEFQDQFKDLSRFAENAYWVFRINNDPETADYQVNIYTEPNSKAYQDLGMESTYLSGCEFADTNIRFTVSSDVHITLEYGEWLDVTDYFRPISEIFSISAQPGTVYEFPGFLAEGRPDYRLRADKLNRTSVWYLQYDGNGENGVVELLYQEPQPLLPDKGAPILSICQAYAGMLTAVGNTWTLQEPDFFWKTLANAVTLTTWHAIDPEPDGTIHLTEWMMDRYRNAMFPWVSLGEPFAGEPVRYDPEHYERYVIQDGLYFDDGSTQIERVEFDEYDRITVTVSVWTQIGQRYVQIYLTPDYGPGSENPFGYFISDAAIARG